MNHDIERDSGTAGLPDPEDVPAETVEALERERSERLAPDNRPDNAEVDNTVRTFDSEVGMFTDSEGYQEADRRFPADE